MSKFFRYFLFMIMIILLFAQIICINIKKNDYNIIVCNTRDKTKSHKNLNDLTQELDCLKEKNIISANESENKWYLKVKLQGTKQELLNEILKLKNYDISDCTISKNRDENSIVLEISAKETS